jgi:hemerythrin-like domain-containing protein
MPILIGAKRESDFTDPVGMLGDCHRRIVRFLHVLVALAGQRYGGPLSAEERAMLSNSLNYFRDAAPKHTADEEQSLFPRLRCLDVPGIHAVLTRIDALHEDHGRADLAHAEVDRLGRLWLANGQLSTGDASEFQRLMTELDAMYRHHIGQEDAEVFPFAERVLGTADREAIGAEMAARRGIAVK